MPARQIALQLSDLSAFGTLTGFIGIDVDGTTRLVELKITRPANPLLKIQEAGESGVITLRTQGPAVEDSIFLVETGGKVDQQLLSLNTSVLRSTNGQAMRVHANPDQLVLVPYLMHRVAVQGTVPEVGEFSGMLVLKYGEQQRSYRLIVQRAPGAQHLSVSAVSPVPASRLLPLSFFDSMVRVPLTFSETGGSQVLYYPPTLSRLVWTDPKAGEFGADFTSVLRDAEGKPVIEAVSGQPNVLRLAPYQPTQMAFDIGALSGPGNYQGTVRVATSTGVATTATFNLAVKDGWLLPALVIILGVAGSYYLRRWLEIGRPAAARELGVRQSLNRLAEAIPEENDPIRHALATKLAETLVASRLDAQTDVDNQVQQAAVQLNNYLLVRDVLTLRRGKMLERIVPNPPQQEALRDKLNQLAAVLEQGGLPTLANDAQGNNALVVRARAIWEEVTRQAAASLGEAITALGKRVPQDRQADPGLGLQLDTVDQQLERAAALLTESQRNSAPHAVDRWVEARAAYDQAEQAYRDVSILRFRRMLNAQNTPPAGFDAARWQQLKDRVITLLPANATADQLTQARDIYLRGVLEGLQQEAKKYIDLCGGTPPDPNYQAEHDEMQEIINGAQAALALSLDQAETAYNALCQRFEKAVQELEKEGVQMSAGVAAATPAPAPGIANPPVAGEAPPRLTEQETIRVRSTADILARVKRNDKMAALITAAVSVVIGLQLLWASNATFGSWNDYITVFLWGFGLSAFNKVALPAAAARLQLPFYPATRSPSADS